MRYLNIYIFMCVDMKHIGDDGVVLCVCGTQFVRTIAAKDEEIQGLKETIQRECEERTMMIISMSELKDQILQLRQQQASRGSNSGVGTGVGTGDHFNEHKGVSQSFLNSLVGTIGNNNSNNSGQQQAQGSSVYGLSSVPGKASSSTRSNNANNTGTTNGISTTFPSINNNNNASSSHRSVEKLLRSSEEGDKYMEDDGASAVDDAAWANRHNQGKGKKSRKSSNAVNSR
jgi:hypothetical protein